MEESKTKIVHFRERNEIVEGLLKLAESKFLTVSQLMRQISREALERAGLWPEGKVTNE